MDVSTTSQIKESKENDSGFTMLELLVAVAIFTTVMTIAGGALASMVEANRESRNAMNVMDNMRVVAETMTREIRDGSNYSCNEVPGSDTGCFSDGSATISFTTDDGDTVVYRYTQSEITKETDGNAVDMTGENVTVKHARFYVYEGGGTNANPHVRMVLRLRSGKEIKEDVQLDVQTSVAHRREPTSIIIQ